MKLSRKFASSAKPWSEIPGPKCQYFLGSVRAMTKMKNPWTGDQITITESRPRMFAQYKAYGSIVKVGLPMLGRGLKGELLYVFDPREFMKVVEKAPRYPNGILNQVWPFKRANRVNKMATAGFWETGEEWWRIRQQLQKNLVAPKAARKYIPSIVEAAKLAVDGADSPGSEDFGEYLSHCTFDMISSVLLGRFTQTANTRVHTDSMNLDFLKSVEGMIEPLPRIFWSFREQFMHRMGIDSSIQKQITHSIKSGNHIADKMVSEIRDRWKKGELTEAEKRSYTVAFLNREDDVNITEKEFVEIIGVLLFAGVDTTKALLHWLFVHLGQNQRAQDKLREEVFGVLGADAGLPQDMQIQKKLPYLSACIRESYRMNVPLNFPLKTASEDVVLGGYHVPAGYLVSFVTIGYNMCDELWDDPQTYRPERWLSDEVEARKGTPREVLDHRLLENGFSFGARMCPGARVANLEAVIFVSEFARRWKWEVDPTIRFEGRVVMTAEPYPKPNVKLTPLQKELFH